MESEVDSEIDPQSQSESISESEAQFGIGISLGIGIRIGIGRIGRTAYPAEVGGSSVRIPNAFPSVVEVLCFYRARNVRRACNANRVSFVGVVDLPRGGGGGGGRGGEWR